MSGERYCCTCLHYERGQLLHPHGVSPAKCLRTAHRDLVHGYTFASCKDERTFDLGEDYCAKAGRHWVQRPEPPPKVEPPKKRRWWQFGAQP